MNKVVIDLDLAEEVLSETEFNILSLLIGLYGDVEVMRGE